MSEPPDRRLRDENAVLRDIVTIYSDRPAGLPGHRPGHRAQPGLRPGRRLGGARRRRAEVLASAGADDLAGLLAVERGALARLVATAAATRRALTLPAAAEDTPSIVVAPIVLGDEPAAYLLTATRDEDGQAEDTRLMVTEHAAMICGSCWAGPGWWPRRPVRPGASCSTGCCCSATAPTRTSTTGPGISASSPTSSTG